MQIRYLKDGQERLDFFGGNWIMEQKLYLVADNLSKDYKGGFWEFAIADNGAKIVILRSDSEFLPNSDFFYEYNFKDNEKVGSKVFSAWVWLKLLEAHFYDKDNNVNDDIVEMFSKARACYFNSDEETQILNKDERHQLYKLLD